MESLEGVVLWEIRYQANRFRSEWNTLTELVTPRLSASLRDETALVVRVFTIVEVLLGRVTHIDRMLDPAVGHAPDSYPARRRVAAQLLASMPAGTFAGKDVKAARNLFEHADEYLPRFLAEVIGREWTQFTLGPDPRTTPRPDGKVAFRCYDPFTGEFGIFGRWANLRNVSDEVRSLLMRLPAAPTVVSRVLVPIPVPEDSTVA